MFQDLFKLRGKLSSQQEILLGIIGFLLFILVWAGIAEMLAESSVGLKSDLDATQVEDTKYISNKGYEQDSFFLADNKGQLNNLSDEQKAEYYAKYLFSMDYSKLESTPPSELTKYGLERIEKRYTRLPQPWGVLGIFPELLNKHSLLQNTGKSIFLNFLSYLLAIIIAIPVGFLLGLIPLARGLFSQVFDSFRFVPLVAVPFLFMLWFGIETEMKVAFLSFGILVYLVPVVVQRIDEVQEVYLKTVFTLGATTWQTIRTVFLPSVLSRVSDDIRVLTAISWTYITVAEMLNDEGGLGGMIYNARRSSNIDATFAVLIVIVLIGITQDWVLRLLDKVIFPFKYQERGHGN